MVSVSNNYSWWKALWSLVDTCTGFRSLLRPHTSVSATRYGAGEKTKATSSHLRAVVVYPKLSLVPLHCCSQWLQLQWRRLTPCAARTAKPVFTERFLRAAIFKWDTRIEMEQCIRTSHFPLCCEAVNVPNRASLRNGFCRHEILTSGFNLVLAYHWDGHQRWKLSFGLIPRLDSVLLPSAFCRLCMSIFPRHPRFLMDFQRLFCWAAGNKCPIVRFIRVLDCIRVERHFSFRHGPYFWWRSYFTYVVINDIDSSCIGVVPLVPATLVPKNSLHGTLAQET